MATIISKVTSRASEQGLVWLVNLLLLALIAQSIASITWQVLDGGSDEATQARSTPLVANRSTQQSAILLAQGISNNHLFGQADSQVIAQRSVSAPETKLNLLLKGVLASSEVSHAVAFISAGQGTIEKSYAIGDSLPSGAILKEIYAERILLEYRGRVENLSLQRKVLTNKELGTQKK